MISELGMVSVVKPEQTLRVIATADLDDTVYGTPAIDGNRIYVRTGTTLYCFGLLQ